MNLRTVLTLAAGLALGATTFAVDQQSQPQLKTSLRVQSMFQNDETCGKQSTFDLKRVRLGFAAAFDEKLSARMAIEGRDKDDGIIVMEAYGIYELCRYAQLQAGQMYAPFGLESRRGFDKREFYDRTYITDAITRNMGRRPAGKRDGRFRDIGVEALGSVPVEPISIGYALMLMNGNGILTTDNNDEKDFVGRLTIASPWGATIGGSFYHGTFEDLTDSIGLEEQAWGLEFSWTGRITGRDCRLEGEYQQGKWDTTGAATEPRGFYAAVSGYVIPKFEIAARYDWFDPNHNVTPTDDWTRVSLALRYFLVEGSFVAVDYEIRDKDSADIGNRLTVQLMTAF